MENIHARRSQEEPSQHFENPVSKVDRERLARERAAILQSETTMPVFFFFCCLETTACDGGGKMELVERNDRHVDFILEQNLNLWANSLTWLTGNYGAIATAAISDVHVD